MRAAAAVILLAARAAVADELPPEPAPGAAKEWPGARELGPPIFERVAGTYEGLTTGKARPIEGCAPTHFRAYRAEIGPDGHLEWRVTGGTETTCRDPRVKPVDVSCYASGTAQLKAQGRKVVVSELEVAAAGAASIPDVVREAAINCKARKRGRQRVEVDCREVVVFDDRQVLANAQMAEQICRSGPSMTELEGAVVAAGAVAFRVKVGDRQRTPKLRRAP